MRVLFALAIGLAAAPGAVAAQPVSPRTLPLVSVDVGVGYSQIPERAGAIYYRESMITAGRVGVAVRLGPRGTILPVLVVDYSGELINSGVDAICIFAPNGTCKDSFPSFAGFGLGLGGRALLGNRVVVGVTGGIGRYGEYLLASPQGGTDSLFEGRRTSYFVNAEVSARNSQPDNRDPGVGVCRGRSRNRAALKEFQNRARTKPAGRKREGGDQREGGRAPV